MKHVILSGVQDIFRDIFDDEDLLISESMSAKDIDEWDSLNNIKIVIAVEKKFKVRFSAGDIKGWKCVGDMIVKIEQLSGQ